MGTKKKTASSTDRVKALRERRAAMGYERFEHYYRKEDHHLVREFVKKLNGDKKK